MDLCNFPQLCIIGIPVLLVILFGAQTNAEVDLQIAAIVGMETYLRQVWQRGRIVAMVVIASTTPWSVLCVTAGLTCPSHLPGWAVPRGRATTQRYQRRAGGGKGHRRCATANGGVNSVLTHISCHSIRVGAVLIDEG